MTELICFYICGMGWSTVIRINIPWFSDHFVYFLRQWETTLQCNVPSHWLDAYTKWFLMMSMSTDIKIFSDIQRNTSFNDDVIKWTLCPPYWTFVRGIHGWFPHDSHQHPWYYLCRLNGSLQEWDLNTCVISVPKTICFWKIIQHLGSLISSALQWRRMDIIAPETGGFPSQRASNPRMSTFGDFTMNKGCYLSYRLNCIHHLAPLYRLRSFNIVLWNLTYAESKVKFKDVVRQSPSHLTDAGIHGILYNVLWLGV